MSEGMFFTNDSSIHLWRDDADTDKTMGFLRRLLRVLSLEGWTIGPDQLVTKNNRSLSKWYKRGRRGLLEMKAETSGRSCEIEFFQNVANVENPHGGEYDFCKLSKMPYLLRLRTIFELRKLAAKAAAMGFECTTKTMPKDAFGRLVHERKHLAEFHKSMYTGDSFRQCRNGIDADGNQLNDGDWRCCYVDNQLTRGQVFYHINNMWWFIPNDSEIHNVGAWELIAETPLKYPRRSCRDHKKRILAALRDSINDCDFRKAEQIAGVLKSMGVSVNVEAECK